MTTQGHKREALEALHEATVDSVNEAINHRFLKDPADALEFLEGVSSSIQASIDALRCDVDSAGVQ